MRKILILLCTVSAMLPSVAMAQGTDNELETGFGARVSAGLDKKLAKGLHLTAEGEVRTETDFSAIGRAQAGLGISYKVSPYFNVSSTKFN